MSDIGHGYPSSPIPEKSLAPPAANDPNAVGGGEDECEAGPAPKRQVSEKVENAVMSYVIPLMAGGLLMTTCWGIGRFGYSFGWIGVFVALNFFKSKLWRQREKRVIALQQTAMKEREVIMAQLQDLPAWVQFPDTERVEWINKVINQLWPYIGEYTKTFIAENIEPQVKANLPNPFKSFRFEQIDMGDIPLRVGGIKVYTENVGRDRIILDMDVAYAGDCEFVVAVGAFKGGLNQMQFKGKLRCILKPLLAYPPMVGGVTAFFLDDPVIDFNLTGLGEMVEIPGLMGAIRSVVTTQVRAICVLPNEIVVPLTAETDVAALHFPEPDGVVRVGVIEARDLENMDMSFIKKGKSDPYANVAVGAQHFTTRVIDNDLNPKWDEWFEAVVDQASGQKLQIEIFDEDQGKDEELGRLTLDLDAIRRQGVSDAWYQLEGAKQGEIRLKLYWMKLSTDAGDVAKTAMIPEWRNSKNPLNPALLMAYVDCASGLPFPKRNLEPTPYVEIRVGNEKRKTYPKPKTVNPLFQHKELFFVSDPDHQHIILEALDEGTKKSLGEVKIPMSRLLWEPNMELYQQTFQLSLGAHVSPIVATFRLRGFKAQGPTNGANAAAVNNTSKVTNKTGYIHHAPTHRVSEHVSISAYKEVPPTPPRPIEVRAVPPPRKSSSHEAVAEWVESGVVSETAHVAVVKEQESLSVRAVKRGDKTKRPLRPGTPTHEKPEHHKSSDSRIRSSSAATSNGKSVASSGKKPANPALLRTNSQRSNSSRASRASSILGKKKLKRNKSFSKMVPGEMGRVQMSIKFSTQTNQLMVTILQAEGLRSTSTDGIADPYVKVRLLVENSEKEEFKTRIAIGTLHPEFNQTFAFDFHAKDMESYSLFVKVNDGASYGLFTKPPVLGKFLFPLTQFDVKKPIEEEWFDLAY